MLSTKDTLSTRFGDLPIYSPSRYQGSHLGIRFPPCRSLFNANTGHPNTWCVLNCADT